MPTITMRRRAMLPTLLACALALGAGAPPAARTGPPPLAITRDERAMLLGYAARGEAIRLRAEREIAAVAAEQSEYLGRLAARLGLPKERLAEDYTVNLDTLAVERKAAAK